ncbi:MAG: hypothetical protein CVT64_01630 [Actinobacteria bacterium HGW-Actinobacteria-4]|nr:MAG: hypothetical protein CVT64_01630 [Actinobacteria bacterium HGW-Actinobacteria-4]
MSSTATRRSNDAGRVPLGTIITLLILVAAAGGAFWLASQYGFLSDSEGQGSDPTTEPGTTASDARPEWLVGSALDLPPLLAVTDEREPQARLMVGWIWEFVDADWGVVIARAGDGDGITYLNDLQVIYLESPEGELFRLYDLRRDYNIDLVHWDPDERVAWLVRTGRPGLAQVVEFGLDTGVNTEAWHDNSVSVANNVAGGVGNVTYLGLQEDGRELWASYDASGFTTGLLWRTASGTFQGSVITGEIRRLHLQGFSEDRGIDAWISVDSMTAVYRATFRVDGRVERDRWIVHNLATDDYADASPQVPSRADCVPAFNITSPDQFDGARIVADCRAGGTTSRVLIDPSGAAAPA